MKTNREKRLDKKLRLLKKQHDRCIYCQKLLTLDDSTFEHIQAKSKGGTNSLQNLVISCRPCNLNVGNASVAEKMRSLFFDQIRT
jgi:uncharacterized protein (TIGR02646 family)